MSSAVRGGIPSGLVALGRIGARGRDELNGEQGDDGEGAGEFEDGADGFHDGKEARKSVTY